MYLFTLIDVMGKRLHRSEYIPPSFVVLRSTVVQNTTFVLLLYSRSVSGGFFLDYLSPFILTCRCPNCSVH